MKPIIPVLLLMLTVTTTLHATQQDISKVNGSISADAEKTYGDLETVNGSITVPDGVTAGEISTVNGSIRIGNRVQAHSVDTVNGSIRLGREAVIGNDVSSVNGSVFVDRGSSIGGDISTVNGAIGVVGTQLAGDIDTVNGDITVGVESQVSGDVVVRKPGFNMSFSTPRKPRIIVGPGASVRGRLNFEREVVLYVHTSAQIGQVIGATVQSFSTDTAPQD